MHKILRCTFVWCWEPVSAPLMALPQRPSPLMSSLTKNVGKHHLLSDLLVANPKPLGPPGALWGRAATVCICHTPRQGATQGSQPGIPSQLRGHGWDPPHCGDGTWHHWWLAQQGWAHHQEMLPPKQQAPRLIGGKCAHPKILKFPRAGDALFVLLFACHCTRGRALINR